MDGPGPPPGDRPPRLKRGQPPIRKSLGQHFLADRRILQRIVDALDLRGGETVVEIGPGRGALTELLVPACGRLIAIEYDRALADILRERYREQPKVQIVQEDVLKADLATLSGGPYSLVGNVPYYITTPILFQALRAPRPDRAVFLMQREVADRIVAEPGSSAYGALSVNVQGFASAAQLFRVAPGAFQPAPKVESAVVRIEPRPDPVVGPEAEDALRRFVQDAFGLRRKQLRRVVRSVLRLSVEQANAVLDRAGLDPEARPETLSPEAFARLLRAAAG